MAKDNGLLNFLRHVFVDEYNIPSELSPNTRQVMMPGTGHSSYFQNIDTNFGLTSSWLKDYLTIENDLISRYVDYEDMDDLPELSASLDIYSDDATQPDGITGKTVRVDCQDQTICQILEDLYEKNLRIDEEVWEMARTLCKYGNDFEEIVIKDGEGVIDLNFLPPPTVRRIEDTEGSLLGFVQDYTANFKITTEEFLERIKNREEEEKYVEEQMERGSLPVKSFENWEVVHMRLRSKQRRSMYGYGVLDSVRWIVKRLMLIEDSMLVYRLCLHGDSNVWTDNGYKKIKDIVKDDVVYCYNNKGILNKTKVVYKKHNGKDTIYKVSSRRRQIFANKTHPILVESVEHNGSGNRNTIKLEYVEVQNIEPNMYKFIMPKVESGEDIILNFPDVSKRAFIKSDFLGKIELKKGPRFLMEKCGVNSQKIKPFLNGDISLTERAALSLMSENGYDESVLDIYDDWGSIDVSGLPKTVDEDFSRWFGFMIGDGFLSDHTHKSGYIARNTVGFACGNKFEVNNKYKDLFKKYVGNVKENFKGDRLNSYCICSRQFYEFMILNGYIKGAHNKRIPEWVFRSELKIRKAFIFGLIDADGMVRDNGKDVSIEMCNKDLVNDLRILCMQSGYSVGKEIKRRERSGGHIIEGDHRAPETVSYCLNFSFNESEDRENILNVEIVGIDDIYDIGVEAEEHNFVSDGVVVHNTRAPERLAFYVDVGDIPPNEALGYVKKVKNEYKKKKWVDPNTGKLDMSYNPLSADEDFFVPVRGDKRSASIESIGGANYQPTDDVNYFKDKLYSGLKIPRDFLNYTEGGASKANLSTEDMRFARSILRIQREIRNGLKKVGRVHLASFGIQPDIVEWEVMLNPPSSIFELAQMEVRNAQLDLADRYRAFASQYWIMREILHMTDEEIESINTERKKETLDKTSYPEFEARDYPRNFFNGNREAEKILSENWEKMMTQSPYLKKRFDELRGLISDMRIHLQKRRK